MLHIEVEQIRGLFESSPIGVALTTFDGRFLVVNEALVSFFRTTEAELLNRPVSSIYVDPGQREELLEELLRTGTLRNYNTHIQRSDGSTFYARLNSSLINLEGRNTILAFVDDATTQIMDEQRVAANEERQRLARELHDTVTQTLFLASMLAQSSPLMVRNNPDLAEQNFEQLSLLIEGALAEMRALLFELRPSKLKEQSLSQLIELLVEGLRARTQAEVALNVVVDSTIPEGVAIIFYRIGQESLNNIDRHALANEVVIDLAIESGRASLTITDDGRGFDLQSIPAGHFGLINMYERAKQIGADIQIDSDPGEGTQVAVSWQAKGNRNQDE